ncbi:MAG TPA: GNAT family N-acetyltransferase [Candidatus Levybacteria bacterium]|nr:GNAT family N-acetyltransferase [Candidatus Levybacteria bacterium]
MNITYRQYTENDQEIFFSLNQKLGTYVKGIDSLHRIQNNSGYFELSVQETLENVAKYNGKILFAEIDNQIIGMICGVIWEQSEKNKLEIGEHTLGEILDLYVDDNYRGQDIGTELLSKMENHFKDNGCDSMWVGVFAENSGARNAYKKFGFNEREVGMLKEI